MLTENKEMYDEAYIIGSKENLTLKDAKLLMSVYRGFINKKFVSNRRTLNEDVQVFLAKSQDYEIRKAIASRVDLCEEAFRILMDDPIIDVVISLRNSEHLTSSDIERIQKYSAKTIPKTTKSSSTTRRSLYS